MASSPQGLFLVRRTTLQESYGLNKSKEAAQGLPTLVHVRGLIPEGKNRAD